MSKRLMDNLLFQLFDNQHFLSSSDDDSDFGSDDDDEQVEDIQLVNNYLEEELEHDRMERKNKYQFAPLKTLCIRVVAKYAQKYEERYLKGEIDHNVVDGPFDTCPRSVLNEILQEYSQMVHEKDINLLTTPVLFITPHCKRIHFYGLYWYSDKKTLLTAKSKCQESLEKLTLMKCSLKESELHDTIGAFKNLLVLDLSLSDITDNTVKFIADNMKSLRFLNLSSTTGVTEKGLKYLLETKLEHLEKLGIDELNVSTYLLMEILNCYPDLILLDHDETFLALELLRDNFPARETKLKYLDFLTSDKKLASSYTSVMQLVPDLKFFSIKYCSNWGFISGLVVPWFVSESITSISFNSITINITDFLVAYPNIAFLSLSNCKITYTASKYNKDLIKKINILILKCCKYQQCFDVIKDIFYSETLCAVTILKCTYASNLVAISDEPLHFLRFLTDCLDGNWLQEIIKRNKNLKSIKLLESGSTYNLSVYLESVIQGRIALFSNFHN